MLRKLMLLMGLLLLLAVAVAPALAADRNNDGNNQNGDGDSGVNQNQNQQADSGDVNQDFNVTGGGDNSNQCVGLQGTANTGNAQNQVGVLQYGSEGDVDLEDVSSSVEVSPTNETSCTQSVNQAASAS